MSTTLQQLRPDHGVPPVAGRQPVTRGHFRAAGGASSDIAARLLRIPSIAETDERRYLSEYRTDPDPQRRRKALENLCLAYGKLVVSIASGYRFRSLDLSDLIGVGFLGLIGAIVAFDLERSGVRLATYAIPCIRHEIQSYIRRNLQPVALPDSASHRQLIRHSRELMADARAACARELVTPNRNELCRRVAVRVGLSEREVENTLHLLGGDHVSLDDDKHLSFALSTLFAISHEDAVVSAVDSARVKRRVLALTEEILGTAERRVFLARCMAASEPAKLAELAGDLGVSSERICQLETSAKRKVAVALVQQGFLRGDSAALVAETHVRAGRRTSRQNAARQSPQVADD
ncbi:MAG TPA: sigma-70 family RNA polymerase sigma factor [Acetobacteraceae bacterium]|nr:sigma-70 family RNA polymerase sigma factor [Acetobacteraceae bacterium]